jgi:hypothetical protein
VADAHEPKGGPRGFSASSDTRLERSRLAHWPPPFRNGQTQPAIIRHHGGDAAKLAKARGWRLTRSMFSDFSDD